MLAEMFMLKVEAAARLADQPKQTSPHIAFDKATFAGFKSERISGRAERPGNAL
jgi:hypothetical protein